MADPLAPTRRLWTLGHSNHTLEHFANLLQQHDIQVLVDVRTSPYSKYVPHFARETLAALLPKSGVKYLFLGKELGGRPTGSRYYDPSGHVLYGELARSPLFLDGLARLEMGMTEYRCAIMCSEEDPARCHRHMLVSRVLHERGVEITHIRGDGRSEAFAQAEVEAKELEGRRETLFGEEVIGLERK